MAPTRSFKEVSEYSPLLPCKQEDDERQHDGYTAASLSSAVFNLSTSIVGAGIMGLPATMNTVGLIPGILLIIFVGFLTNHSIDYLLRYSSASKAVSYSGVMADSFGRIGRVLLQLCIIVNNFGLLVVYLIIIADVLSGSTISSVHHSGVLEEWAGGETWWNQRTVVMLVTTIFILAPLACVRHVDSLELTSALSVGLAILFVVVTAAIFLYKLAVGTIGLPKLLPTFSLDASTILGYFSVVPILVTAYICHHSIHPILNELKRASDSTKVIRFSLGLCTSIYVTTSVFGYLLFGEGTLSDVLSNFDADLEVPHGAVLSDVVRVGYAVHLMLVYPLLNFSLRLNVDGLVFPRARPISLDDRRFYSMTFCLVAVAFVGASFVPDIWDAFQFTGSTSAVCLGFVFPGSLVLRDVHNIATRREKVVAWFMVLLAAGASCIAISGDIYELFA
ncbi:hypothetical protein GOP47_0023719 [Adiantum capillus-veneris]|uniref:Amino acid transporter transmembrane domain-containing protein n=1 Tax=Adiantum capillus-veneris TaxID=13818 RepID=A0A9D4U674_ADICA|nr:hypothetical protein GOP47_0023719 [Adiantum capillus-veneris]